MVGEDDVAEAMVFLLERAKLVVEGAGAVGVAALLGGRVGRAGPGTTAIVLSGGNVDPGLLAQIARRHESQAGRRLVLLARLPDRPGSLALLLSLVGEQGANLLDVEHIREGFDLHVRESAVQLVLETRGPSHAAQVAARGPRGRLRRAARVSGRRAAAVTSAPITRLLSSASGCHWTPSTNRRSGRLDRLGELVERRGAGHDQALADRVDALVVVGLGAVQLLAGGGGGAASRRAARTSWSEPSKLPRRAAVVLVAERLGQVLEQRAAEGDVEHLHAAADPEHRHVALHRARGERDLERVALGDRALGRGVALGAVVARGRCRAPPARISPSIRSSVSSGSSSSAGSGGIISASAAGALDRARCS